MRALFPGGVLPILVDMTIAYLYLYHVKMFYQEVSVVAAILFLRVLLNKHYL